MSRPKKIYDPKDLLRHIPNRLRDAMFRTITAWPPLELGLTNWIGFALDVRISEAAIILGAMDARNKLDKLKALYVHRNSDEEAVALLKSIASGHQVHAHVRNTIAHSMVMGVSKSDTDCAYFLTSRASPDEHGFMSMVRYGRSDFVAAGAFAIKSATSIRKLLKARGATDV